MAIYETVLSLFAKDNTARAFQSLNRRLKKLGAGIAGAATRFAKIGTAAALAAGAATSAFVGMRMAAIDNLAKTADKIGTTTEALAGLQHAGELTGVSTRTMNMALQRMTRRVAEAAQGTGEAKNALKELGIDAEALKNLPLDQQMQMVADSMAGVESQADRVRLAMKLFDSEGVALVNTLGQGGDALRAMMSEADQLGISLSRVDAAKIEQANDAASRMTGVFTGIGNQLAVSFSPMIEAASNWVTHLALTTEGFGDIGAKAAGFVATAFHKVGDAVRGLKVIVLSIRLGFVNMAESVSGVMQGVGDSVVEIINSALDKWNTFSRTIIDGYNDLARHVPFLDMTTDWSPTVGKVKFGSDFWSSQEAIFAQMGENIRRQLGETLNTDTGQAFEDALGNFVDRFQSPDAPGQVIPPEIDEGMTAIEDKAKAAADNVRSDIADSLIAGVTDGKDAMISSFADTLQQMSMELLKSKLISGLEKIFGGSADGGFFANLGSMFSKRANGGPVTGGVPYVVGERGPEIMVPGRNGTIIPNQRVASSGMNYAPVVNISGGATAEDRAFFTAQLRNQRAEIADLMARGRF
jgi:hypothetical protein